MCKCEFLAPDELHRCNRSVKAILGSLNGAVFLWLLGDSKSLFLPVFDSEFPKVFCLAQSNKRFSHHAMPS